MQYFEKLIGNDASRGIFARHIERGTLAHAYLFCGPDGSGKEFFARQILAALGCENGTARPCGSCPSCRKILNDQSADVHTVDVDRGKSFITVDKIRAMKEEAVILPNDLDCKAFLIRSASRMNVQAQNALLKLLEEPPAGVYLFLLCEDTSALLPTILSRVETIRMQRFSPAELEEILRRDKETGAKLAKDPQNTRRLLRLADGAIGQARELLGRTAAQLASDERMHAFTVARSILEDRLLAKGNRTGRLSMLQKELTAREDCAAVVSRLCDAMHDLLALKRGGGTDSLLYFTDEEDGSLFADALSAAEASGLYTRLLTLQKQMDANLNLSALLWQLGEL